MLEPLERLLDTRSAAVLLSVPASRLQRWRQQRIGPPYVKLDGGAVRYRLRDLNEWVKRLKLHFRPDPVMPWQGLGDAAVNRLLDGWEREEARRKREGW